MANFDPALEITDQTTVVPDDGRAISFAEGGQIRGRNAYAETVYTINVVIKGSKSVRDSLVAFYNDNTDSLNTIKIDGIVYFAMFTSKPHVTSRAGNIRWLEFGLLATDVPDNIIFLDTFTSPDGTLLNNHASEIDTIPSSWWVDPDQIDIQSGRARKLTDTSASYSIALKEAGLSSVIVKGVLRLTSEGNAVGLIGRAGGEEDYWFSSINAQAGRHEIWERTGSTNTLRASSAIGSFSAYTDYVATLEFNGNVITSTIDNRVATYTSSQHSGLTLFGFRLTLGIASDPTSSSLVSEISVKSL